MNEKSYIHLAELAKSFIDEEVSVRWEDDYDESATGILTSVTSSPNNLEEAYLTLSTNDNLYRVALSDVMQFLPKRMLLDKSTKYYFVVVRFGKTERSKEHYYLSWDFSIQPGDQVLVWQDWLYVGNVIRTGFFTRDEAPKPVDETLLVQKKVFQRINFNGYSQAATVITSDNLYKDNALNNENDYKQFLAVADMYYQSLSEDNTQHLDSRKPETDDPDRLVQYIIGETEYNLDWEWCESNQIEVFYRTLWICAYMARHMCYSKFHFDKYLCLSLIYKIGDFDAFMLLPQQDKLCIQRDVNLVDNYIASILTTS